MDYINDKSPLLPLLITAYSAFKSFTGWSQEYVAMYCGISLSTLKRHLKGETNERLFEILIRLHFDITASIEVADNAPEQYRRYISEFFDRDGDKFGNIHTIPSPFGAEEIRSLKGADPTERTFWNQGGESDA